MLSVPCTKDFKLEFYVKIMTVMCLAKMILPPRKLDLKSKLLDLFCDSLYVHLCSDFSYLLFFA